MIYQFFNKKKHSLETGNAYISIKLMQYFKISHKSSFSISIVIEKCEWLILVMKKFIGTPS